MDIRRVITVGVLALLVSFSGCTSTSNSNRQQPKSGMSLGQSRAASSFGDPRYQDLVKQIEQNGGTATFDPEPPSTMKSIGNAFKKATASVGTALTPKPKVVKAPDPVSLASMPDKIDVDVYYRAGRLAETNGNTEAAIKQYTKGLEVEPDHLVSLISLARIYDRQEKFGEAEKLYRKAIKIAPESAMAHNDLGLCLARQERGNEALAHLRRATELEPKRKLYHNNLATVLVEVGQNEEAWNVLSRVHPEAIAHYNLGYLMYRAGNNPEAIRHFTAAYQQDASLDVAARMIDELSVAKLASSGEQTRVHYSVEDEDTRQVRNVPAEPAEPAGQAAGRITAHPVAMVHSPAELRRIPPTSASKSEAPAQPPTVRLLEPVPINGVPAPGAPAGDTSASDAPASDAPGSDALQFPIRRLSAQSADQADASLELPTPALLENLAPRLQEPGLLPADDAAAQGP